MHHYHKPDHIEDKLYVITALFNPHRYNSRWKLYKEFQKRMLDAGVYLVTIECSFGDRSEVTVEAYDDHMLIHVRTAHEIWIKENLINIAVQRLPRDWKYVAWIDGDVEFARPDWAKETLHQLQHYDVLQLYTEAIDLGPNYEFIHKHKSFMWCYKNKQKASERYEEWHPGYAWAATRTAWNHLGGLIDWGILGSGDRHMASALIGKVDISVNKDVQPRYKQLLYEWQERAESHIRRNVGYIDGLILHYWHGAKANRRYKDRWKILVDNKYNPDLDIKKDWQGVYQLTDRSIPLRDEIREYFKQRNEDCIFTGSW